VGLCMRQWRGHGHSHGKDREGEQHFCHRYSSTRSTRDFSSRYFFTHDSSDHHIYFYRPCAPRHCSRNRRDQSCGDRAHPGRCHSCLSVESGPLLDAAKGWVFLVLTFSYSEGRGTVAKQRMTVRRQVCREVVKSLSSFKNEGLGNDYLVPYVSRSLRELGIPSCATECPDTAVEERRFSAA
jgi:hypothetical protein